MKKLDPTNLPELPLDDDPPLKGLVLRSLKSTFISALILWGIVSVVASFIVVRFETVGLWVGWIVVTMNLLMSIPALNTVRVFLFSPLTWGGGEEGRWHLVSLLIAIANASIHLLFAYYIYLTINGLRLF